MEPSKAKPGSDGAFEQKAWKILSKATPARHVPIAASLLAVCVLLGLFAPKVWAAQNGKDQVEFLVARNQIHDPFFEHSVVVMLPSVKSPLVVGLIVNKPTRMPLGSLFPKSPAFSNRTDHAFFGGPVNIAVASLVFHSPSAPDHAFHVFGDVYLTFDSTLISSVYQNSQPASKLRLFLGRSQWAPEQLTGEMREGAWYKIEADGNLIFSTTPQTLWRTLHQRAKPNQYIRYRTPATHPHASLHKAAVM